MDDSGRTRISCITDGILIAAAFLTNFYLGLITALAILAHEIPQQVGDFIVLLNAGFTRKRALLYSMSNTVTSMTGALIGLLHTGTRTKPDSVCFDTGIGGFYLHRFKRSDAPDAATQHDSPDDPAIFLVAIGIGIIFPDHAQPAFPCTLNAVKAGKRINAPSTTT